MSWISITAIAAVFGAGTATALVSNWRSRASWTRVGARLGLTLDGRWPAVPRMSGTIRGFDVVVTPSPPYIAVQVLGVDPWFTLEKAGPSAQLALPSIDIDGWGFDDTMRVCGDRDFALGLLKTSTRRAAESVVLDLDGRVTEGKIVVQVKEVHAVPQVIGPVLHLARVLRRPSSNDIPRRLANNAKSDSSKALRFHSFLQLVREFSGAPEVLPTACQLLKDQHDELRLEAANVVLGRDDDPLHRVRAAEVLSSLAARGDVGVGLRRSALDTMVRTEVSEQATTIALGILRDLGEPREMREHALVVLAHAKAVPELLALQTVFDGAERARLAWALGRSDDVAAQPRLLELLSHADEHVRMSAIEALGAVGDARAVLSLRQAAGEKTLIQTPLAQAVEDAVLQIRLRLGGSQAGEISIVGTETLEGAISTTKDDGDKSAEEARGGEISRA